jgi:hypothetical protein
MNSELLRKKRQRSKSAGEKEKKKVQK